MERTYLIVIFILILQMVLPQPGPGDLERPVGPGVPGRYGGPGGNPPFPQPFDNEGESEEKT